MRNHHLFSLSNKFLEIFIRNRASYFRITVFKREDSSKKTILKQFFEFHFVLSLNFGKTKFSMLLWCYLFIYVFVRFVGQRQWVQSEFKTLMCNICVKVNVHDFIRFASLVVCTIRNFWTLGIVAVDVDCLHDCLIFLMPRF